MKRKFLIIVLFLTLLIAASLSAQQNNSEFEKLSSDILKSLQSFYPVRATEMGIHSHDHRLADYSASSVNKFSDELTGFEKRLYKYKGANLSAHDHLNLTLLKANVDVALQDVKRIRWHQKSPQLYIDEAVNGIYFLMLSESTSPAERLLSIMARMKDVPRLFESAQKNISSPPQVYIDAALESLESGMRFYKQVTAELSKQFPERADELIKVSTHAQEAMNDFAGYLSSVKRGDDRSFAIGKENFDYKLSNEYFLGFDSDSLLRIGQSLLEQARKSYAEYAAYTETNHKSENDSIFVPATFTKADIIDYYNWETSRVSRFLQENNIITVPQNIAPVTVIETPEFLRTMIGGIAYQPAGPFDSVQHGYFYVRPLGDLTDRTLLESRYKYVHRRGFKGSVVHEAYPGHHLQLQIAGMNPDPVRKWQFNIMMIEGWALYCEQMMYEKRLYGKEDPAQWLGVLGGIRFRAARIVADVSLHTGKMTYDECVKWMWEVLESKTDSEKKYIETEVRRYTVSPTYQMSYLMGK
ncbi:MAG TPA: DUF885 domain-containing protein, partial [candidate division Zixibacteria bacterium]|nr:DUF885 domain-containing protein [candidate division Zixibacteria bacterium]